MGCFAGIESLLVGLVIIIAVVAIVRILLAFLPAPFGGTVIVQVVNVILWAIVAIAVIYIVFTLLGCVLPLRR